ncbi:hypothetical protein H6F94_07815 [Leptolyngbya sp. FACHB-261]|nr:hypothetical protein [Leptolyngbya sp. FACHB-261]
MTQTLSCDENTLSAVLKGYAAMGLAECHFEGDCGPSCEVLGNALAQLGLAPAVCRGVLYLDPERYPDLPRVQNAEAKEYQGWAFIPTREFPHSPGPYYWLSLGDRILDANLPTNGHIRLKTTPFDTAENLRAQLGLVYVSSAEGACVDCYNLSFDAHEIDRYTGLRKAEVAQHILAQAKAWDLDRPYL